MVYSAGYSQRPDPSLVGILSGIEMACWDIVGKAVDKPVYELLGGRVHERLRSYTYLYPEEGDGPASTTTRNSPPTRAAEYVRQGFTAVKFDPVGPYSAFDPRQLVARDAGAQRALRPARCARRSAANATCCSGRMAR